MEQLELLIAKGKEFTYQNFSEKSQHGYPNSFTPEWTAWQTRVQSIIIRMFGKDSAHNRAMVTAFAVQVLGNGPDKFEQCRNYIIGTLQTAVDTLIVLCY